MSLFKDIATSIKGVAHDAVDALTNDDSKGRQLVRDANDHSRAAETAGVEVEVTLQLEKNKYQDLVTESTSWEAKANKALDSDDEQLATDIMARKVAVDEQIVASQARIDALQPQVTAMKQRIAQAVEMNNHTAEKIALASANSKIADATLAAASVVSGIGNNSGVADDVARMEAKSKEKLARAQILGQHADVVTGGDLDSRISALNKPSATNALEALKAKRAAAQQ